MSLPYIPFNPHLKQSKLRQIFEKAPKEAINLGLGQPGEDTPAFIREAAARVAMDKPMGYTLNAGLVPLREKLAEEYAAHGITANHICLTTGVQEGLYSLFYTILDEHAEILLPDPGFLTYPALSALNRCEAKYYKLNSDDNFRFNAERVIEAITPKTTAVLLGHPSNPTGSVATREELQKLVDFAKNRKEGPFWIISDEVYFGMSYTESASMGDFISEYPHIVILRGASKSHHMTGWRLGWTILPESLVKPYIATHQYVCTCASSLTQFTFLEIRGSLEEKEWLDYQVLLYKKKRDMVEQYLSDVRPLYGGEGAFYWVMRLNEADLRGGSDEDWVIRTMTEHLVTTTPGSAFGQQCNGYARISYGPKMEQLEMGLIKLRDVLSAKD
jgi:aspartate/methionine/tyrosine aminotransferase